jgi:nucleotide-binding universal stress UspA family protein
MTKIIAFVDGSTYSKSVCDHAAWIAARIGASVSLLHVLARREGAEGSDLSGAISLGARSALMEQLAGLDAEWAKLMAHRGRAILEDAAQIVPQDDVEDVTTHLRHGDLAQTITEQEAEASMVLIGKRGEGSALEADSPRVGSHLERILRAATKPVLIASRAFKPITKVLVAWDGHTSVARAVDHMSRDPLFAGLEVRLVSVGAASEERSRSLETGRAVLEAGGLKTDVRIAEGEVAAVLANIAETEGYGLVVMGSYGHSRLRSLVLGSTTTEMIRSCKVPLLVMR